jgi:branched-chain amino acid aminotransferase
MKDETPPLIWFNGSIVPWDQARVHVWTELAIRGASVFEGIRAYWTPKERRHYLLDLEDHLHRLFESAKLLKFPSHVSIDEMSMAIFSLLHSLNFCEHAYVRPTLYIEFGRYGFRPEQTTMGAHIAAFPIPHAPEMLAGIRCCISSWRRTSELSLSPRIKAGGAYLGLRLPRIEAAERELDEVILLNEHDTVAEASGGAVFIVRKGQIATPPLNAGLLESITRRRVMGLLRDEFDLQTIEREINRTELYTADEVLMCGTLCEILPIVEIDGYSIGNGQPGPITTRCRDRYLEICESGANAPEGWLTVVPEGAPR